MADISVIIPVTNENKKSIECLDSLELSVPLQLEKMVVNVEASYGKALNDAIKNSAGDYIAFIYPKDQVNSDKLAANYGIAKRENLDVLISNYFVLGDEDNGYQSRGMVSKAFKEKTFCPMKRFKSERELVSFLSGEAGIVSKIFKKDFLIKNRIYFSEEEKPLGAHNKILWTYNDMWFGFNALSTAERVRMTNEAYLYHSENEYDIISGFSDVMLGVYARRDAEYWNKQYISCLQSSSYRVGKYIIFLPKTIYKMVRSIGRHGLKHTFTVSLMEFLGRKNS